MFRGGRDRPVAGHEIPDLRGAVCGGCQYRRCAPSQLVPESSKMIVPYCFFSKKE